MNTMPMSTSGAMMNRNQPGASSTGPNGTTANASIVVNIEIAGAMHEQHLVDVRRDRRLP